MLRSFTFRFVTALLFSVTFAPYAANAMSLDEIYRQALNQSETVQSAGIDIDITKSQRERVLTTQKPRINLSADATYQVTKFDKEPWSNSFGPGIRTEFRQPIYDGGIARAAIKAADANITASKWDYKTQQQYLYVQLAGLFYDYLGQARDLVNLEDTLNLYNERVKDLAERERIGRSRDAEVLSAKTQISLTRSLIATSKTNLDADEVQIAWLSGLALPLHLTDTLDLSTLQRSVLPNVPAMLPTVEAAAARIEAASATIDLTRAAENPKFDFIADHQWRYIDASNQGSHAFGIGVGLTWLLYNAGEINAEVSTATFQKTKATVAKQLADRQSQLDLALAKRKLADNIEQIKAYKSALEVVEKTLKAQQLEFNSGLITNLEMLTTLDQRLSIRRNLDLATYRAKLTYVQSQVYGGRLLNDSSPH